MATTDTFTGLSCTHKRDWLQYSPRILTLQGGACCSTTCRMRIDSFTPCQLAAGGHSASFAVIPSHCPDADFLGQVVVHHQPFLHPFLALSACLGEAQVEKTPANQAINCPKLKAVFFADLHLPTVFYPSSLMCQTFNVFLVPSSMADIEASTAASASFFSSANSSFTRTVS